MIRIALLSPIHNSLYSRLVAHLVSRESDMQLVCAVVRTPWDLKRIRSEMTRDGVRLLKKVQQKLILGDQAYPQSDDKTLPALAKKAGLIEKNLGEVCRAHDVPCLTVRDHNDPRALDLLRSLNPDVIAFTGGGLLRKELLSIPRLGVLNCHSGLLPLYRGMDVVEWPMVEGTLQEIGVGLTLHFMDAGVDTGPILLQRRVAIRRGETIANLRRRMEPMMVEVMLEGLRGLRDQTLTPKTQSAEEGRQYFVMHPRVKDCAEKRLQQFIQSLN